METEDFSHCYRLLGCSIQLTSGCPAVTRNHNYKGHTNYIIILGIWASFFSGEGGDMVKYVKSFKQRELKIDRVGNSQWWKGDVEACAAFCGGKVA